MSRSNYSDDYDIDQWQAIMWRGAVTSAIKGKRGQAFLREMIASLDALPEKKLVAGDLQREQSVCAIGAVGLKRGVDMSKIDPENSEQVAHVFGISDALAREIVFMNDEYWDTVPPEVRFERMRRWAQTNLVIQSPYNIKKTG